MTTQILAKFENSLRTFRPNAFDTAQAPSLQCSPPPFPFLVLPGACFGPFSRLELFILLVTVVVVVPSAQSPVFLAHKMFRIVS